jgi:hypothetical protein
MEQGQAQIAMQEMIQNMQQSLAESRAKVAELEAKAVLELAQAKGVETGHMVGLLQVQAQAEKLHGDRIQKMIDALMTHRAEMAKIGSDHVQAMTGANNGANIASGPGQEGLAAAPAIGGFIAPPASVGNGSGGSMVQ